MSQGVFCLLFARKMEHLWKGSSVSDCASGSQESRPSHNKQQDNAEYPASLPKNLFPGWDFPCLASSSTQGTEWIPEPTALQGCTSSPRGQVKPFAKDSRLARAGGKLLTVIVLKWLPLTSLCLLICSCIPFPLLLWTDSLFTVCSERGN